MSQKKKTKRRHEKIFEEIIAQNFPKRGKEIAVQVQEIESPKQDNPKAKHSRRRLIKLTKIQHKEQILKAAREKQQVTYKLIPIRIRADFSVETLQATREWQDILKVMKEENLNQDYSTQQGSQSDMKEKSKAL